MSNKQTAVKELIEKLKEAINFGERYNVGNDNEAAVLVRVKKLQEAIQELEKQEKNEVPYETLVGLYRIMCGVSSSFPDNAEVYNNAKPGMKQAMTWILEWGKNNSINMRGDE